MLGKLRGGKVGWCGRWCKLRCASFSGRSRARCAGCGGRVGLTGLCRVENKVAGALVQSEMEQGKDRRRVDHVGVIQDMQQCFGRKQHLSGTWQIKVPVNSI